MNQEDFHSLIKGYRFRVNLKRAAADFARLLNASSSDLTCPGGPSSAFLEAVKQFDFEVKKCEKKK